MGMYPGLRRPEGTLGMNRVGAFGQRLITASYGVQNCLIERCGVLMADGAVVYSCVMVYCRVDNGHYRDGLIYRFN